MEQSFARRNAPPLARPPLARRARERVKDLAIRLGLWPYRPLAWSLPRWEQAYRAGDTDGFGELVELARYSLLAGYLLHIRPARVLDVGCGEGLLRRRIAPDAFVEYVGIDHSETAIEKARTAGLERSRFLVGDAESLALGPFDAVICNEVLYFLPDLEATLARLETLLVPRGHLLVSNFRHAGDVVLWRALERRFELVDRVWARNERNPMGWRGWGVAWLRRRDPDGARGRRPKQRPRDGADPPGAGATGEVGSEGLV